MKGVNDMGDDLVFAPKPITLSGDPAVSGQYWGIRLCQTGPNAVSVGLKTRLRKGKGYISSKDPKSDGYMVSHEESGKSFYLYPINTDDGSATYFNADNLVFMSHPMDKVIEPRNNGKMGDSYTVIPAQGFGDDQISVACKVDDYYGYIAKRIKETGELYRSVLDGYDKLINKERDPEGVRTLQAKKETFRRKYANYASVSAYKRHEYLKAFKGEMDGFSSLVSKPTQPTPDLLKWKELLAPPKKGRKYGKMESELKEKAAIIRSAVKEMSRLYKIVLSNNFEIPYPQEMTYLQSYLENPSEEQRQKLTRITVERVKSSADEYIRYFEWQVRKRIIYALIRVTKGREDSLDGEKLLKLNNATRYYQILLIHDQELLKHKGDLDSFFIWAKDQAKKVRSL